MFNACTSMCIIYSVRVIFFRGIDEFPLLGRIQKNWPPMKSNELLGLSVDRRFPVDYTNPE